MNNTIISICREYCSGGKEIGKKVSDELGYTFLDKQLITEAAKKSGYDESVFEKVDEQATNSLLYSLSMGLYNFGNGFSAMGDLPMNDQLYIIQHKMIKRLAEEGPCVILGRCADYVLRDFDNVVNIFINADMEYRKERAIKYHNVDKRKVEQIINRTDKNRANYYSFYSGLKWGQPQNYDLCINSSRMTQENVVDIITNYVDMLEK